MPVEIGVSMISVFGNHDYYVNCWDELPHEIDAECHGVLETWDVLLDACPGEADRLMLGFVNERAENTQYVIRPPEGGFLYKEQVEKAFSDAYDEALSEPRRPHPGFRRYGDAVSRMTCEDGRVRPEFHEILDAFMEPVDGATKDRMMASLACLADPSNQWLVACLKDEDLSVRTVFGTFPGKAVGGLEKHIRKPGRQDGRLSAIPGLTVRGLPVTKGPELSYDP